MNVPVQLARSIGVWQRRGWAKLGVLCFPLLALLLLPQGTGAQVGPAQALTAPDVIYCQGYERDRVLVGWRDLATDETNYRVERSVAGAPFTEVATIAPNAEGNYPAYEEPGVDVSVQNRRYRVRAFRAGDGAFSAYSPVCNNRRIAESSNIRVFYGVRGSSDDCPPIDGKEVCVADVSSGGANTFITRALTALQGSADSFGRVGFTRPAAVGLGGADKVPINVVWCDGGGCAGGSGGRYGIGLSPEFLETPFDPVARTGDPALAIVSLHEMFHYQQFRYSGVNDPASGWIYEGQARSIQDKICIGADRTSCQHFDDINTGMAGYVGEVQNYLRDANRPINQVNYQAALFWTYLTEKFGTSAPTDTVERGMNLISRFWETAATGPGRDGITILNETLTALGHTARFRDIWKDFAVANYAKNLSGPGVPAKYRYADMAEPGGTYGGVALSLQRALALGDGVVDTDETVKEWGARYYELAPAANVPTIDIKITQDSANPVYYTVLALRGTDIVSEYNVEARNLNRTLLNDTYDKVVVIVAALENAANYRYSFNGTTPSLRIVSPTTGNKARVGSFTAPDKFRVAVELVAADGTPLTGANLANFSFRVGTVDVPAANILTSATIASQQWFVLRAPIQAAAGQYSLVASYGSALTSTQLQAVDYTPRLDTDNVLIFDRSGSMIANNKLETAKAAARLFVDSWRGGDKLGIVSFSSTPTTDMTLRDWTDAPSGGSRRTALDTIGGFVAGGATAIGDALRTGWSELIARANVSHDWTLVLLSDGREEGTITENFDTLINALRDATGKRPVVHTVAIGPDADRLRMQRAANDTGGTYQAVSVPTSSISAAPQAIADFQLDMDSRHRAIATEIAGQEQFFSLVGPISDGVSIRDHVPIPVEGSVAELVLSLSWNTTSGSVGRVRLRDPSNNTVIPFKQDTRHFVWRVPTPDSGNWTLEINTQIPEVSGQAEPHQFVEFLPPYLVQGSVRSVVTLEAYLTTPVEERIPGVPMGIVVSLTDNEPIRSAVINASVEKPDGTTRIIRLWDDGQHGDGSADDGIYGNTFRQTRLAGSYNLLLTGTGTSLLSGPFTRQALLSFHLEGGTDTDQDGLPDDWERRYGTDPTRNDAKEDPDNDGLPTSEELERGTDPNDSDTDDGGEADGSDKDPLEPGDDGMRPSWVFAYPGIEKVLIRYVQRPEYTLVKLFRAPTPAGPWTEVDQQQGGTTSEFIDAQVVNGIEYCYYVVALDDQRHQSAAHTPSCAMPKQDPVAPHGFVRINNGATTTVGPDVTLTLWASDAIDPEAEEGNPLEIREDSATGVREMRIGNSADVLGSAWEPYAKTKAWRLAKTSGLGTVFVQYRDAAGNESDVYPATINVGEGSPGFSRIYMPFTMR